MNKDLSNRLIAFGSKIIGLSKLLGKEQFTQNIKIQIIKSATSVGANYQESQFASSKPDFINKLHISLKEMAETIYWLKIIKDSGLVMEEAPGKLDYLIQESEELRKILTTCIITAKNNLSKK